MSENRHKIFEPKLEDVLMDFPEYKTVKKYEKNRKRFYRSIYKSNG